jgi:predicted enzyme related to lactoylglutathione lyase
MSHLPGKFVWFEHVSGDIARARAFYEPLLGWSAQSMPMGPGMDYTMIVNGGAPIGGWHQDASGPCRWVSHLSVDDVDGRYAAALAAGATAAMPPMDFGQVGRGAAVIDPTGAALNLWRSNGDDPADVEATPVGGWFWNELMTPDAAKALAFHEQVFGFTHDSMDMGPQGTYYLLKTADGRMRGGLMQSPMPEVPAMWLPYVKVADCDATAAQAVELGAKVMVAPTDIPNVGRFAVLCDPQGASLAVMKPV